RRQGADDPAQAEALRDPQAGPRALHPPARDPGPLLRALGAGVLHRLPARRAARPALERRRLGAARRGHRREAAGPAGPEPAPLGADLQAGGGAASGRGGRWRRRRRVRGKGARHRPTGPMGGLSIRRLPVLRILFQMPQNESERAATVRAVLQLAIELREFVLDLLEPGLDLGVDRHWWKRLDDFADSPNTPVLAEG